ncbi:hypothetical protein DL96DRAFT_1695035 [Flagelloscypha sp. PMI_526]|nr:hypothetical protein DL96DRAFT_1695035 [Flagelloscypha sp. PMI_526]
MKTLMTNYLIGLILVFASNIVTVVHDIQAVKAFMNGGGQTHSFGTTSNSTITNDDYILGSTVPNQPAGAFWAVLNRLLIIGWPSRFFNRFFPILGEDFGLGALGIIQCLIGAAILSHHVDDFTLVAAFFLFSIGCLNMLLGLIFRQGAKIKRSLTAWKDHAKSALPTHVGPVPVQPVASAASSFISAKFGGEKHDDTHSTTSSATMSSMGFGRQVEKAAGMKGLLLTKPLDTLPRYAPSPNAA